MEQGKEDRIVLYLKNCRIHLTTDTQVYFQKKLYISISGKPSLQPGNTLFLNGTLLEFPIATNPGMFNRREYYKEKGIYYEFRADSFQVLQYNIDPIKNILPSADFMCRSLAWLCESSSKNSMFRKKAPSLYASFWSLLMAR